MAQGVWLVQQGRRADCLQSGQSRDPYQVPAPRLRDSHAGRGLPACPSHQGPERPRPPDVGSPKLGTRQAADAAEQEAEKQAYRTRTASRAGHQCADLQVADSHCTGPGDRRSGHVQSSRRIHKAVAVGRARGDSQPVFAVLGRDQRPGLCKGRTGTQAQQVGRKEVRRWPP